MVIHSSQSRTGFGQELAGCDLVFLNVYSVSRVVSVYKCNLIVSSCTTSDIVITIISYFRREQFYGTEL